MKLYELPSRRNPRPRIVGLNPNGDEQGVVEFDHIDGAYSFCVAYSRTGGKMGIVHLSASTELTLRPDGDYELAQG